MLRALLLAPLLMLSACGSKLPRELTDKAPGGRAEPLALNLVTFADVRTGETVNLQDYMDANGRDFVLMTFGSEGCAACNEKARHLTKDVIGKHPLYLSDPGRRFEIVGVNTDPDPGRLGIYLDWFPYIQWSDPSGALMLKYFMPAGNKFRVPLTVMISRRGIEWRVMPDDRVAIDEMMARVEFTLGLRDEPVPTDGGDGSDGDGGDGGDGGSDGDEIPVGALATPGPGRLKSVTVAGCDGADRTLEDLVGAADLRFVQVTKGSCDATCTANLQELSSLTAACAARGRSCATATLTTDAPGAAACAAGVAGRGGDEVFTVFRSHFNWNYPRAQDPATYMPRLTRDVEGPLVLVFDRSGALRHSSEGAVTAAGLDAAVASADFAKGARGPDFRLFDPARGVHGLADVRRGARFTVVNAFGFMCGSCINELKHWSEAGNLVDFCAARPADCQVMAVETGPLLSGQTLTEYHQGLKSGSPDFEGFDALGIRASLALDALPKFNSDGSDNLERFFEGYLVAITPNPDWWADPRTVIYDREGKIVGQYRSEDPAPGRDDPVFARVKELVGP